MTSVCTTQRWSVRCCDGCIYCANLEHSAWCSATATFQVCNGSTCKLLKNAHSPDYSVCCSVARTWQVLQQPKLRCWPQPAKSPGGDVPWSPATAVLNIDTESWSQFRRLNALAWKRAYIGLQGSCETGGRAKTSRSRGFMQTMNRRSQ